MGNCRTNEGVFKFEHEVENDPAYGQVRVYSTASDKRLFAEFVESSQSAL
jgi:hypothetical protein